MNFKVVARIEDDLGSWREDFFVVCDKESEARNEVEKVVSNFNNNLRPFETPRQVVAILSIEESNNDTEINSLRY